MVKATFFGADGGVYFTCNDKWWPRDHYLSLFAEAGFVDVTADAQPFGPGLERAAAVLGVGNVPASAPERAACPVLIVTGIWPGTD